MRRNFFSWAKPLGQYVYRFGKRFFVRPKNDARYRQLRYYRPLRIEALGARVMLTTTYVVDPSFTNPDLSHAVFDNPFGSGFVSYPTNANSSDDIVIQSQSATQPETVTIPSTMNITAGAITVDATTTEPIALDVSGRITAGSMTVEATAQTTPTAVGFYLSSNVSAQLWSFDSNGSYSINFPSVASNTISGGSISIQSALTVEADSGVTATIASAITGSANQLIVDGSGALALTGSVTVAAIQETAGTLALHGPTTITNGGGSLTTPIGLLVSNDATIKGTGPLTLEDQTGQTTPTPFNYGSSSTAQASTERKSPGPDKWRLRAAGSCNSPAPPTNTPAGPVSELRRAAPAPCS